MDGVAFIEIWANLASAEIRSRSSFHRNGCLKLGVSHSALTRLGGDVRDARYRCAAT